MLSKFVQYLSIFSLCIFLLGFSYLYGYYEVFNISIIYYITSQEVFFVWLPVVMAMFAFGAGAGQGLIAKRNSGAVQTNVKQISKKTFLLILISFSAVIIVADFLKVFGRESALMGLLAIVLLVTAGIMKFIPDLFEVIKNSVFAAMLVFLGSGFILVNFGRGDAAVTKRMGSKTRVNFRYRNKSYITNDSVVFIGQTQSTIFVFIKKDTSTLVIPRSAIDSLVIMPPRLDN